MPIFVPSDIQPQSTSGVGDARSANQANLPSSSASTLYPSSTNLVFRGASPNVVSVMAVPTVFRSEIAAQPVTTGYLLQYTSAALGSQQLSQTVAYYSGLSFAFNISVSENEFTIIRSNITSLTSFLAQLVGALSGTIFSDFVCERVVRPSGYTRCPYAFFLCFFVSPSSLLFFPRVFVHAHIFFCMLAPSARGVARHAQVC